jgi:oligo-1,6-glucosidase
MLFQFELMDVDSGPGGKWNVVPFKLTDFKRIMSKWQYGLGHGKGWNSLYMNNHDQPRMVSRFGDDQQYRLESAKMLGTLLHTLQGTPYVYQGEEIGMTNVKFDSIEQYQDIETHNMYNEKVHQEGQDPAKVMQSIYIKGRDNARTPMQWDDSPNAGFTTGKPWLAVNPNYQQINAKQAVGDPNSIYNYYKRLIQTRRDNLVLIYGEFDELLVDSEVFYAYTRTLGEERALVVLNFTGGEQRFELPEVVAYAGTQLLISNYEVDPAQDIKSFTARPYEARVYRLS